MSSIKRFDRCFIHIGTEKTGSSFLQKYFSINRSYFNSKGVLYCTSTGKESQPKWLALACDNFHKIGNFGALYEIEDKTDLHKFRETLKSKLEKEFAHSKKCSNLLISSEHLHSQINNSTKIIKLKSYLDKYVSHYKIIFYLRRQDLVATSLYSTTILSGSTSSRHEFVINLGKMNHYFNYYGLYKLWAEVFGDNNVIVRPYKEATAVPGDLIKDFCDHTTLNIQNGNYPDRVNNSISNDAINYLRCMNKYIPLVRHGKINKERININEFIKSNYPGSPTIFTKQTAESFYAKQKPNNDKLCRELEKSGSHLTFDSDFSMYPDDIDHRELTLDQAIQMSSSLILKPWSGKEDDKPKKISSHSTLLDRVKKLLN
jgi:hypothetical protein